MTPTPSDTVDTMLSHESRERRRRAAVARMVDAVERERQSEPENTRRDTLLAGLCGLVYAVVAWFAYDLDKVIDAIAAYWN